MLLSGDGQGFFRTHFLRRNMTVNNTMTLRYRWDSGGGWYEIPARIFKTVEDFKVLSAESRVSRDHQTYFLDGEHDGKRFINRFTKLCEKKLQAIEIVEICEGARSSIRDLSRARGAQ